MTLTELKKLGRGDRVEFTRDGAVSAKGAVNAADALCLEIFWADGTSSVIWFAHCSDGRDPRYLNLTLTPARKAR